MKDLLVDAPDAICSVLDVIDVEIASARNNGDDLYALDLGLAHATLQELLGRIVEFS